MKGIVFNLLEQIVTDTHGEATWEALLAATKSKGAYTSLGNYPDAELFAFVGAASKALNTPAQDVVRWFGRECIPHFAKRYPTLFTPHHDTRTFVLTLNDIIHPEVRKLYPGADVPVFDFQSKPDGTLSIGYVSKRKLCAFAEGLIEGSAQHYGQSVKIRQSQCMLRNDPKCVLVCTFEPRGRTAS